ncbi:MAG: bifunctional adenosylcobinamide kinase/adenosylcobinamide-phosphate guanylyltransferase [Propioniciclava sp.]|uniref:bifunctional adenosylcobinamide kinase/adenosylcobinamide-phosphate guanylyltransferase n=1 Tax=Propioniciclava sp. TaxID=2038686 RepID=UPI0039E2CCAD
MTRMLITGGVRCGKSRYAEQALAGADAVTYVTPGYPADPVADPEWAARVAAHRASRPASWTTVETVDVAAALREHPGPVLVDCLGTWLTRQLDAAGWDSPRETVHAALARATAELADAVAAHPGPLVLVSNEVGWGLISEHASGRLFADLLGRTNQAVGAVVHEVVLMVAGRPLRIC